MENEKTYLKRKVGAPKGGRVHWLLWNLKKPSESAGKQTERSEKRGMGTSPHKQPRGEPKRVRERRADAGGNVQPPAPPLNSPKKSRGKPSAKIERLRIKARLSWAGFVALGHAERQARRRALNKTPRKFAVPTSELLQLKIARVVEVVERVVDIGFCPCFIFQA
jgi:hypothetical protein